jgi:protein-tyrosine phosphatase
MIHQVLVVCIGNICRSPMAEGLLRRDLPKLTISSAGLDAMVGYGADPMSVQIMAEQGIDIQSHRAKMMTDALVRQSDLILVMDNAQKEQITSNYPYTRGKVFRLGEPFNQDIPDPFRQSAAVFRSSFDLINRGCEAWLKRINSIC